MPEILGEEEAKFERTLQNGLEQISAAIEAAKGAGYTWIDGDTTFRLYDTFGFPLRMTGEIAAGAGLTIDEPGFRRLPDAQRSRSRATAKFSQDVMRFGQLYANLREKRGLRSQFTGYGELETDAKILSLVVGGEPLTDATEGTDVEIVLDRTPFYPEGGGQVGDRGTITTDEGRALVADTQTAAPARGPTPPWTPTCVATRCATTPRRTCSTRRCAGSSARTCIRRGRSCTPRTSGSTSRSTARSRRRSCSVSRTR